MVHDKIFFPDGFRFGASTASYQIEGAVNEDGKGESVWDVFCKQPGRIRNGDTGDVACNFYHRYKEDVQIMKQLGLDMFRFSICWPRVLPQGKGKVNEKGLDFYNNLVDELLANGIEPFITLNHWDYPQALQETGGWSNRDNCKHFADYAELMVKHLGDRVRFWTTHNEPHNTASAGYIGGFFAPGVKDLRRGLLALHHLNLGHGMAVQAMRGAAGPNKIDAGIVLAVFPIYPATGTHKDIYAAYLWDGFFNRCFLDPIYKGTYPQHMVDYYGSDFPEIPDGDMDIISQPLDVFGINCYFRRFIEYNENNRFVKGREYKHRDAAYTYMDWEIWPESLYEVLRHLSEEYGIKNIYITENGACFADEVTGDGKVHDLQRKHYLAGHFEQARRAIDAGVDLKGYLIWSLLDNFEWVLGYSKRFGIVYVDYETQQRIIKDSGKWYSELIKANKQRTK